MIVYINSFNLKQWLSDFGKIMVAILEIDRPKALVNDVPFMEPCELALGVN